MHTRNQSNSSTLSVPDLAGQLREKIARKVRNTISEVPEFSKGKLVKQRFNLQVHRDAIDGQLISEGDQRRRDQQKRKEMDAAIADWRTKNGITERDGYIRLKEARGERLKILDRMNESRRKKVVSVNGMKNLIEVDHKYIDVKGAGGWQARVI